MTPQTKIRFTETDVNAIPFSAKRARWHDNQMPGLVLDVTSKAKVFRVYKKLSGRRVPVSVTLGTFPALSVETARKLARKAMADMADGVNPNDSKRQFRAAAVTLQDVFQEYLEQRDLKPATLRGYHANMKLYIADWHNKRLSDLSEDMIAKRHLELTKRSKAQADYCMRMLRALFNFAKAEYKDSNGYSLFPNNPVQVLSAKRIWNNVARKQTRLRPSQLRPFLQAITEIRQQASIYRQDSTVAMCDYIEFITYTGLRKSETMTLAWSDIYMADGFFMVKDTKNGDDIELPITVPLLAILKRRKDYKINNYVFGVDSPKGHIVEPKKTLERIRQQADVSIGLHDLRRTYCSIAENTGVGHYTLKRLLNHKTGRNDVTGGYTILTAEELHEPAERIAQRILQYAGLVEQKKETDIVGFKNLVSGFTKEQKLALLAELMS